MNRRKMRAGCGAVGGWRVLWIVVWAKAQTAVRVVPGMVRAALAAGAPTPTGGRFFGSEAVSEWLRGNLCAEI